MIGIERFDSKICKAGGCWLWTGALSITKDFGGYGRYNVDGTLLVTAHRFAYETLVGPIPDGLQIDHLCRVRCCVNPEHLEPVTGKVNVWRGKGVGPRLLRTHCNRGHEYTPENTKQYAYGRQCRTCAKRTSLEWYRRSVATPDGKKQIRDLQRERRRRISA